MEPTVSSVFSRCMSFWKVICPRPWDPARQARLGLQRRMAPTNPGNSYGFSKLLHKAYWKLLLFETKIAECACGSVLHTQSEREIERERERERRSEREREAWNPSPKPLSRMMLCIQFKGKGLSQFWQNVSTFLKAVPEIWAMVYISGNPRICTHIITLRRHSYTHQARRNTLAHVLLYRAILPQFQATSCALKIPSAVP